MPFPRRIACAAACVAGAVTVALSSSASASTGGTGRIINGSAVDAPTYAAEWNFAASLVDAGSRSVDEGQFCGGSLITPTLVLTAAHCVTVPWTDLELFAATGPRLSESWNASVPVAATQIDVVTGRRTLSATDGRRVAAAAVIPMPNWRPATLRWDAALVRLPSPAPNVTPISLVAAGDAPLWGAGAGLPADGVADGFTDARVAGWGEVDVPDYFFFGATPATRAAAPRMPADTLRQVTMPIVSDNRCKEGTGGTETGYQRYFDASSMICAGTLDTSNQNDENATNNGLSACYGDSGGPLVVGGTGAGRRLAGIVSFGEDCGSRNRFSVFTRVDGIRDWVESNPIVPPSPRSAPRVVGRMVPGTTLTCARGAWSGGLPMGYSYRWASLTVDVRDDGDGWTYGVAMLRKLPLSGTGPRYVVKRGDLGRRITCIVVARNGWGTRANAATPLRGPLVRSAMSDFTMRRVLGRVPRTTAAT